MLLLDFTMLEKAPKTVSRAERRYKRVIDRVTENVLNHSFRPFIAHESLAESNVEVFRYYNFAGFCGQSLKDPTDISGFGYSAGNSYIGDTRTVGMVEFLGSLCISA